MYKRLTLSRVDRMLVGVCGGLGEYFKIDSTIIRILFVLMTFIFWGSPIIIYIIFAIIIPKDTDKLTKIKNNKEKKHKEGFYDFTEFDDDE